MNSPDARSYPPGQVSYTTKHPRLILAAGVVFSLLLILSLAEICLRLFFGLGDPLLYQSSPLYGYRLQPGQHVHRINGAEIRVNNLGLRAESDWDSKPERKILFLGNSVTFGGTFLSNKELFSHLAVQDLGGYVSGNGAVNGWGVENIHALIVDYGFLPASVYVTILEEMDFDRGLSKFAGQPFWSSKPRFALEELLLLFCYNYLLSAHDGHDRFVTPREREKAIERSVLKLKSLDDFIKSKGFVHRIYFSTDKPQLLEARPADTLIMKLLRQYDLNSAFMKDRPELASLTREEIGNLFYDWNHLDKPGHELWARMIGSDLKVLLQRRTDEAVHEEKYAH